MFLHLSVSHSVLGGVYPSMHWTDIPLGRHPPGRPPWWPLQWMVRILLECILVTTCNEVGARLCFYTCLWFCSQREWGWYPSMPCSRSPGWGGIPACLAGFQAHTQGGSWGVWPGGSPGPHPRGKLRGLASRGLQAHTQGGSQAHTRGSVSQHALRQTPLMATAAGSMYPTGMHFCFDKFFLKTA